MSTIVQIHPSADLFNPVGPSPALIVRLHPSVVRPGLAEVGGRVVKLCFRPFQTLRTAVGLPPAHGAPHGNRSRPRGIRVMENRSQLAPGGPRVQPDTAPIAGRIDRNATQVRSSAPTVDENTTAPIGSPDFASVYCAAHRLRREQFVASVFRRALRSRGPRFTGPILRLLSWPAARERAFLVEVGGVRSVEQYGAVEERFRRWPASHSLLRRILGVRVSTTRVRRLVVRLLPRGR